jgi:putative flippase GtrA
MKLCQEWRWSGKRPGAGARSSCREPVGAGQAQRMTVHNVDFSACAGRARRLVEVLPRPVRFIIVGCTGLVVDLTLFTAIVAYAHHPLVVRLITLTISTTVTWRLNRAFTFTRSNRAQHDEAMRYAIVTALAQGTSYAVFAALVLTVSARLPQAALMAGALVAAFVSYNGHRLFAFAPRRPPHHTDSQGTHRP